MQLAHGLHAQFAGRLVDVLFEMPATRERVPGWSGLTDNYLRVWVACDGDLRNQIRAVRCLAADTVGMVGVVSGNTAPGGV